MTVARDRAKSEQSKRDDDVLLLLARLSMRRTRGQRKKAYLLAVLASSLRERLRFDLHKRRERTVISWPARVAALSERQFVRRYRMSKAAFHGLADQIREEVLVKLAQRTQGRVTIGVPVEVLLSMTIRWLAGGAYVDIADLHGVSETCFWNMLPPLMESIANLEGITPAFPMRDEAALQEIADGFAKLDKSGIFTGCVGALDGLIIEIIKPALRDCANPANYRNRKEMWAVTAQVMCDHKRRITFGAVNGIGSTCDSVAWECTELAQQIAAGNLPARFYISADAAYGSHDQIVVPWCGTSLPENKDAFNFFQSSQRIEVECTIGLLKARWGILWRPLRVHLDKVKLVVATCMALHNYCIDMGEETNPMRVGISVVRNENDAQRGDLMQPYMQSDGFAESTAGRGRMHVGHAPSSHRNAMTELITDEEFIRPARDARFGRGSA